MRVHKIQVTIKPMIASFDVKNLIIFSESADVVNESLCVLGVLTVPGVPGVDGVLVMFYNCKRTLCQPVRWRFDGENRRKREKSQND